MAKPSLQHSIKTNELFNPRLTVLGRYLLTNYDACKNYLQIILMIYFLTWAAKVSQRSRCLKRSTFFKIISFRAPQNNIIHNAHLKLNSLQLKILLFYKSIYFIIFRLFKFPILNYILLNSLIPYSEYLFWAETNVVIICWFVIILLYIHETGINISRTRIT